MNKVPEEVLCLDARERTVLMNGDFWVDYGPGEKIFKMINNISRAPKRITAPALIVSGIGGTGKSAIVKQIPRRVEHSDGLLFLDMAVDPEYPQKKKTFNSELCRALGIPPQGSFKSKQGNWISNELSDTLKLRGIWGIVLDEIHELLLVKKDEQRVNGSILKTLMGEKYGQCLFGFGVFGAATVLGAKPETKRRFTEIVLSDWRETEEFRGFLLAVEENLPLREPSKLYEKDMVRTILQSTHGRMDQVINLVRSAGCYALQSGKEHIDIECLKAAAENEWLY
ncbi:TniB family NTP-binding protein [Pseudomonas qingdaonensis]|uniref:TniB family NTP-binding protein n=1 Tax=Pseudomonas qingdaonensis TaxID=2056231 RepID=UPI0028EAD85E|nr:TniB family NTP-binding protein [Pseudomonas qingdaonensis]MEC6742923.1 TniB family NTP-binding protein [Pseudomonas qingdaonensis]